MESAEIPQSGATGGRTKHYILGTAGHIDHGKTRLVKALTGTETDRLPEERHRGMTIELGFAELTIGDTRFGVVDVPGHERFVRTMVAGATAIDVALIVVAADDSVMPQTVEHVEILHLLGVSRAVVAITKIDTVEPDMVDLVAEDVRDLLAGTPLQGAALCRVSSTTGAGIDALKTAILEAAHRNSECRIANSEKGDTIRQFAVPVCGTGFQPVCSTGFRPVKTDQPPFRMSVDRVFSIKGRGTVVTGSVLRGAVTEGATLEVWPHGDTCRVRDLQTHGVAGESLAQGQRAAINLSGIDRDRLSRGSELASPGYLQPSRMVDVRLQSLSSCERPLKSSSIVRLGIGTMEVRARVVLYEGGQLEPGASTFAQLRSGEAITATYGQRFIVRDEAATRTIGGGVVLRPIARRRRRDLDTELEVLRLLDAGNSVDRVEQVLRVAGFVTPTDLQICARTGVELSDLPGIIEQLISGKRWVPIAGTGVYVVPAAVEDLKSRFVGWLERYHRSHVDAPGRHVDAVLGWLGRMTSPSLSRPLFDRFIKDKAVKLLGSFACLPAFAPALTGADEKLMAIMLDEIRRGGFQPPTLEGLSVAAQADRKRWQRLATLAVALGEIVQIEGKLYLHAEVERQLRARVDDLIRREGSVTVAEVREALQSSRKFVVPFLEYLDRAGFTKRIEDRRVLGSTEAS